MKIKSRILIGFSCISIIGFYFFIDFILNEIRPRYLETVEESLNDSVNIVAAFLETNINENKINVDKLDTIFKNALKKRFKAKIFAFNKEQIDIHTYVTNAKGIVIYDSNNKLNIGKDYSRWNDVYLALKGKYGVRSTKTNPDDPSTSSIFVASSIRNKNNKIIGVVTLIKPKNSVILFINLARKKVLFAGIIVILSFIGLSILLSFWINRPIKKLVNYVNSLRKENNAKLPKFDSSEISQLGLAFEKMKDELEGKKYIEHYIQTLTHELKSPLSSIRGASELLEEDVPEKQKKKFYNNIKSESKRIENIIQRLLELSSLENRKELRKIEVIKLYRMAKQIVKSLEMQIIQKKVTILIDIKKSIEIKGEKFLLYHAIENLLQNAIRFSGIISKIIISSQIINNEIHIVIKDQGEGIPDYALLKIFNKFYSLPDKINKKKSTGLGLPFVKDVAVLHNGDIEVKNNHDSGVTARFILPYL